VKTLEEEDLKKSCGRGSPSNQSTPPAPGSFPDMPSNQSNFSAISSVDMAAYAQPTVQPAAPPAAQPAAETALTPALLRLREAQQRRRELASKS
jgi:hypothetical protein